MLRQTPGGKGIWEKFQFSDSSEVSACDYWIVLNDLPCAQTVVCPPERTILFALEAESIFRYPDAFIRQFGTIVTCQKNLSHPRVVNDLTTTFWFLERTFDELIALKSTDIQKTRTLSLITSNKTFSEGHRKRLEFAQALKSRLGEDLDIFGRGIHDFDSKWEVLAPYRFSIVIENTPASLFLTEKMCECFLTYTFPFYIGCSEAEDIFPPGSFIRLDPEDLDGAEEIIRTTLACKEFWEERLPAMEEARRRYLYDVQFFPRAVSILRQLETLPASGPVPIRLNPHPRSGLMERFIEKVRNYFRHS